MYCQPPARAAGLQALLAAATILAPPLMAGFMPTPAAPKISVNVVITMLMSTGFIPLAIVPTVAASPIVKQAHTRSRVATTSNTKGAAPEGNVVGEISKAMRDDAITAPEVWESRYAGTCASGNFRPATSTSVTATK